MSRTSIRTTIFVLLSGILSIQPALAVPLPDLPGDPSGNGVQPYLVADNPNCSDLGLCPDGFKPQPEPPGTGIYTFPDGVNTVVIVSDGYFFDWSSTIEICAVIVKGGDNADVFTVYPTKSTSDTLVHAPYKADGTPRAISHIEFCYDPGETLGSLKVTKTVNWNGVAPDTGQTFQICITGPSYPGGDCKTVGYNGGTATWTNLIPGSYTVTETNPGAEWTVAVSGSPATVVPGQTAQASVTNTHKLGGLEVTKTVNWNGVTPDTTKTFQICITGPSYPGGDCKTVGYNGGTATWANLIPGSYVVTETDPGSQWTVVVSGSPAAVVAGQTAHAGVTNTHKLGSLEVTKTVNWNGVAPDTGQTFQICITGPSYPAGDCKTVGYNGGTATWTNLIPGSYVVTETDPGSQWTVVVSGSPAAVVAGQTAHAGVTNTRNPEPGTIIIEKLVNLDCVDECDEPPTFTFSGDIAGSIKHGEQIVVTNLPPGEYTSTEVAPGDWFIGSIVLDDDNSSFVISGDAKSATVTFRVEAGETVKAVFTNTKPSVTVSITSGPGGRVTSPGEGDFEYCMGTTICLDAKATDPLFEFVGWRGTLFADVGPDCDDASAIGWGAICGGERYGAIIPACAGCLPLKVNHDHFITAVFVSRLDTLYVDDDGPNDLAPCDNSSSDPNENGTAEHPFDSIQEAIEVAREGVRILVAGGVYHEQIDFMGKCIRVEGLWMSDSNAAQLPVVDGNGQGPVVMFSGGEDANCVLAGLHIQGGYAPYAAAILCTGSPTIVNCSIAGNRATDPQGAVIHFGDSAARFINCTIAENAADAQGALMVCMDSNVTLTNSILWSNTPSIIRTVSGLAPTMTYCDVEGGWTGTGNVDLDPAFVRPGSWWDAGILGWARDDLWTCGDYHLLSEAGHWDAATGMYVEDTATSPCIDAGDPSGGVAAEPSPNGGTTNMGAYGGSSQASLSQQ